MCIRDRNTDSLIGAIVGVLSEEGIELVNSTKFLGPLLPEAGVLTKRAPNDSEAADIAYGHKVARQIAGLDLGQMVVVRDRACVAIEAMEGTDETIERAARIKMCIRDRLMYGVHALFRINSSVRRASRYDNLRSAHTFARRLQPSIRTK